MRIIRDVRSRGLRERNDKKKNNERRIIKGGDEREGRGGGIKDQVCICARIYTHTYTLYIRKSQCFMNTRIYCLISRGREAVQLKRH